MLINVTTSSIIVFNKYMENYVFLAFKLKYSTALELVTITYLLDEIYIRYASQQLTKNNIDWSKARRLMVGR